MKTSKTGCSGYRTSTKVGCHCRNRADRSLLVDLGAYLEDEGIFLVMVNPYALKQTTELDDNSQSKNDRKDLKVIAKLVIEGRYSTPYKRLGDEQLIFRNEFENNAAMVPLLCRSCKWSTSCRRIEV